MRLSLCLILEVEIFGKYLVDPGGGNGDDEGVFLSGYNQSFFFQQLQMLLNDAPILKLAQDYFPGPALIGNRLRILVGYMIDSLQRPVMSFHAINISKISLQLKKLTNYIFVIL